MEIRAIPICYHPTRVILIEDDQNYIDSLLLKLAISTASYQSFTDPIKAVNFLKKDYRPDPLIHRHLKEDVLHDRHILDINVRSIYNEIYNAKRFAEIAVLVIDCAMPGMNGLEVCDQLKDSPFKRILLTSETQPQIPIQGFNDGHIHQYVRKDSDNFSATINAAIERAQWQYFLEQSAIIRNGLPDQTPLKILSDINFIQLFNTLRATTQNSEFYLLDKQGSFLLLDKAGKPSWLLVKSEQEMKKLYEYAKDEEAPVEVVKALEERTALPYFHTNNDIKTPPSRWQPYLHLSQLLEGEQRYYYAFITDENAFNLQCSEILSYEAYLGQFKK